jgi:hypothetical protein
MKTIHIKVNEAWDPRTESPDAAIERILGVVDRQIDDQLSAENRTPSRSDVRAESSDKGANE